jgi:flagellar hook protein FlgE
MNRALFAGLSGTIAFQNRLDVVATNLANATTVGYKEGRVTFQDALYQTLRGGRAGSDVGLGALNPMQIGSGVSMGSIQVQHRQGSLERTGQPLDAAIEGGGMFMLSDGNGVFYTRDGAFVLDNRNTLVGAGTGYKVRGWMGVDGQVNATGSPSDLVFQLSDLWPPQPTGNATVVGNLDATSATAAEVQSTISVYDSLGEMHQITVTFTKTGTNEWECEASFDADTATTTLTFDADGKLTGTESVTLDMTLTNGATSPLTVAIALGQVTQLAQSSSVAISSQDGRPPAALVSVHVSDNGLVEGQFSDGRSQTLAQLALANFSNPGGLRRIGSNLYEQASAAGPPTVGPADTGGRGRIVAQALEMSNVDLTKSFVDMITTQRGFQASTRVIASANEMLDDVVRLIRS